MFLVQRSSEAEQNTDVFGRLEHYTDVFGTAEQNTDNFGQCGAEYGRLKPTFALSNLNRLFYHSI